MRPTWPKMRVISSGAGLMVYHVNAISSHHWAAGATKWVQHSAGRGPSGVTSIVMGPPQSPHEIRTVPLVPSAAGIPRASRALLAK